MSVAKIDEAFDKIRKASNDLADAIQELEEILGEGIVDKEAMFGWSDYRKARFARLQQNRAPAASGTLKDEQEALRALNGGKS